MNRFTVFSDKRITDSGPVSRAFRSLGLSSLHEACRHVQGLPYGYNSDRDDPMILFKEKKGSCTTKHAVIATLAEEIGLPIHKYVGIYAMTENVVTGTNRILRKYDLAYVPMLHCFLVYGEDRVDLTEGNFNGKNRSIDEFLYTEKVIPNISAKEEYRLYRKALQDRILVESEFKGVDLKRILRAREEGLALLKANINS